MKKASDLIDIMMNNIISNSEQRKAVSLFSTWSNIVGINEGSHSKIIEIEKNTVFVKVDHPGWLQKLELNKKNILKKLKIEYPELNIKNIRFFL